MEMLFNPIECMMQLTGVNWKTPPTSPTDPGRAGDVAYDATYFYFCLSANTWVRKEHGLTIWTVVRENIIFDGENVTYDGEQTQY